MNLVKDMKNHSENPAKYDTDKQCKFFILLICISVCMFFSACGKQVPEAVEDQTYESIERELCNQLGIATPSDSVMDSGIEIELWYGDSSDAAYYESAAESFYDRYGITVHTTYYDGVSFLEDVNAANIAGNGPDVLILSNDQIEKARRAGIIEKNNVYEDAFIARNFPQVAINALTSDGDFYGYPIYFDTYFLVYDASIVSEVPETIEDILKFSESFEDPENQKIVFAWDIDDPFYCYMFMGGYASFFGTYGEDKEDFDLTNENVIAAMTYYQQLGQYYSVQIDQSNYADIKAEIEEGNIIFTIARDDILSIVDVEEGKYELALVPALTDELESGSLSITYGACVNYFSEEKDAARLFSCFLSYEYSENLFTLINKTGCKGSINRVSENEAFLYSQYLLSDSVPKTMEMSEFWAYSQITLDNIWEGADVETEMHALQTLIEEKLQ